MSTEGNVAMVSEKYVSKEEAEKEAKRRENAKKYKEKKAIKEAKRLLKNEKARAYYWRPNKYKLPQTARICTGGAPPKKQVVEQVEPVRELDITEEKENN